MRIILSAILVFLTFSKSLSQIGSISKFNHLRNQKIVIQVVESPCPHYIDVYEKYGFSLQCVNSMTKRMVRKNRRAIRKINKTYGINWFQNHYNSLKG